MHPATIVIYHGDIYGIVVIIAFLRLLEALILKVETVIAKLVIVILGDSVKSLMNKNGTGNGQQGIQYPVARKSHHHASPETVMNDYAGYHQGESGNDRIDDHRPDIELQAFLCPRSNARYSYTDQFKELA